MSTPKGRFLSLCLTRHDAAVPCVPCPVPCRCPRCPRCPVPLVWCAGALVSWCASVRVCPRCLHVQITFDLAKIFTVYPAFRLHKFFRVLKGPLDPLNP